jgi:hypothetical protein
MKSEIIKKSIKNYLSLPYKALSLKKENAADIVAIEFCKTLETQEFDISYRIRPKNIQNIPFICYDTHQSLAIVMQGPLRLEDHFTLNTVKYYKRMYPSAYIIVSTWSDEDLEEINSIKDIGAFVITMDKPESGGQRNINYQLINTYAGIVKANELQVDYICKTRTDQRINKPHILETMINSVKQFPVDHDAMVNSRLVCVSLNYGNLFYPYFMTDFFYLGERDVINILFDGTLDSRNKFEMPAHSSRREYATQLYAPEVYILKKYLDNINHECQFTVKDYWEAVKKYLICYDMKMVDLVWPKYSNKYLEHRFYGDYFVEDTPDKMKTMNWDFGMWFNLYSGTLKFRDEYEIYADVEF